MNVCREGCRKFGGEHLCDPLTRKAGREGRLQHVICYRAVGDQGIGFGGEEEVAKICSQPTCFPGQCCLQVVGKSKVPFPCLSLGPILN